MPAKKKTAKPKSSIPTPSIPTVSPDAQLTVEKEIHGETSIPEVALDAPVHEEKLMETASDEPPLERTNRMLFAVGIAMSAAIFVGSLILLVVSFRTPKQSSAPPVTPSQVALPPPTPTPQFVRGTVVLDVMNGSGVAGAAGVLAGKLSARGYTIATIGNAPKQATTTVLVTAASQSMKEALMSDVSAVVPTASYTGVLTEGTASARIILGKE